MKKLLLSSVVAATMLSTASFADVATDGTGQFLVAPAYFAQGDFSTHLRLVNTDTRSSVLLRGVIREYYSSHEIDFIITLSPSDVWDAEIKLNAAGDPILVSTDDSNYRSAQNPIKDGIDLKAQHAASGKAARSFKKGYVEFYPIASYSEASDAKVNKSVLDTRFANLVAGNTTGASVVGNNSVAGFVTITNTKLKAAMKLPMMAFENVAQTTIPTGSTINAGADTTPGTYINQAAVYTDLAGTSVTATYDNSGINDAIYLTFWGDYAGGNFAESNVAQAQTRSYVPLSRDMEENRFGGTLQLISPAPASSPNNAHYEFSTLLVNSVLKMTNSTQFKSGMVQLNNLTNNTTLTQQPSATPSFIATGLSATKVDGAYSYSWTYLPKAN